MRAREVGKVLEGKHYDSVFVSDMRRTQQTAHEIFGQTFPITLDPRLREAVFSTIP
jgi:broad specificity phosphatase PhoE